MNESLIDAWNSVVKDNDIVYYLGDFALCGPREVENIERRLNGTIYMLYYPWHHDQSWLPKRGPLTFGTRTNFIAPLEVLDIKGLETISMCHFPMEEWSKKHYGAWHVHAHSHGVKEPRVGKILDVGVDSAKKLLGEYRPFSLEEVIEIMEKR